MEHIAEVLGDEIPRAAISAAKPAWRTLLPAGRETSAITASLDPTRTYATRRLRSKIAVGVEAENE
jgi:hypothetical protein